MDIITNPQNYNICFSIASLLLLDIIFIVNATESGFVGRQKSIFTMLIIDAMVLNTAGLLHNLWISDQLFRSFVSEDMNNFFIIIEKMCSYFMGYLSMIYVIAIFRLELDATWKKVALALPVIYSLAFYPIGLVTGKLFYFEGGDLHYYYPIGASVNISLILYFIFAGYLYAKYGRSLSTEKIIALIAYYLIMLGGVPVRIITKSSSIFEFSVSLALLLCVYTFQNPSEFTDNISGASTKNALNFVVSNSLLQKKFFSIFGIAIERLDVIIGGESIEAASELLSQITTYLRQFGPEGNVYYMDDSNFMILFPEVDPEDSVIADAAQKIKKRFKDPWMMNGKEVKLFESPYVIGFPDEVDTLEKFSEVRGVIAKVLQRHKRELLRVSDLNLKHVEYDKKIDSIVRHALDDKLLEVYYQPIYSPQKGCYNSCEALLRLKDPQLGFISPAVFMPVAERNGMVIAIDRFVLDEVCRMLSETDAAEKGLEYVEVNLSVVDCIQANLADRIWSTMEKYGIGSRQINFEITETYQDGISSVMDENIDKMIEKGLSFSMDDFGTGYSNLSRISSLPVELFKLDKSIVQSAFESETSYMVMLNMVKIIKSLKKEIVAEGVETEEQAKQIIRLGIDHIQGFFYARPMPRKQFLDFIGLNNK